MLRCIGRFFRFPAWVEHGLQLVALGRNARQFADFKAALGQRVGDAARHRPGGHTGTAPATAGDRLDGVKVPDVGVTLRAEAVQVHRVHRQALRLQHGLGVPNAQGEQHLPVFKTQPVQAR